MAHTPTWGIKHLSLGNPDGKLYTGALKIVFAALLKMRVSPDIGFM
jgi:hypothetical protein